MSTYAVLRGELYQLVKTRGRVKAEELAEWARKRGIGPLALSVIVNDLLAAGLIRGRGPKIELGMFTLPVPAELEATPPGAPRRAEVRPVARLVLELPPWLADWLKSLCRRLRIPVASFIRMAVIEKLASLTWSLPPEKRAEGGEA